MFRTSEQPGGGTQGGLILLTLFDLIFNNIVRNCLTLMVEDQLVAQEGMVLSVSRCMGIFYAYDGGVGSQG